MMTSTNNTSNTVNWTGFYSKLNVWLKSIAVWSYRFIGYDIDLDMKLHKNKVQGNPEWYSDRFDVYQDTQVW